MSKKTTSPWDFGELFPPEQTRRVFSVSELTGKVKRLLEQQLGQVWVSGEVTNLRLQSSGHCYFTLKDAAAQLSCVLFRGVVRGARELLEDGRKVLLQGELTVYEPRGQYQLIVAAVELQGVGALQLAFERLKARLQAEGLFAPERKRPLPRIPRRLGIVTSPTGAALRDVLHGVARRDPAMEIVLAPCRVQGEGAAPEIAGAIGRLNRFSASDGQDSLDLILVTRGGGSLEDLWAFNEEVVARAIFESSLPVVSAVGHEIDFTIADFVADVRAATPTAAAEIITAGVVASREAIIEAPARLDGLVRQRLERMREQLHGLRRHLARSHPRRRLNEQWQRFDDLRGSLSRATRLGIGAARSRWETALTLWRRLRPVASIAIRREGLARARRRLIERANRGCHEAQHRLGAARDRLRLLSPDAVLARGYSITFDATTGRVIRAASDTASGRSLKTRLHRGEVRSVVTDPSS